MNNPVSKNPAASFGVAGAVALLIARVMGVDDADTIVALSVVLMAAPAGIAIVAAWVMSLVRTLRPPHPTLPPPSDHL